MNGICQSKLKWKCEIVETADGKIKLNLYDDDTKVKILSSYNEAAFGNPAFKIPDISQYAWQLQMPKGL